MLRMLFACIALFGSATQVFAETATVSVPPIWSFMLLVMMTAFLLFTNLAVRDLSSVSTKAKNVLTTLIVLLWLYCIYYFH